MANSGIYQCFVSTIALVQVAQASAELNVLGTQPIFFETFKSAVLEEGHSLVLSCKAKGIPAPSIEWFVDGVRYLNVPDLTIPRVDVSNAGFYTCVATNELGSNSHTARVDIYAKIQRKVATRSMTVTQGSRVEVFCSFAGYPIDSVVWMKDNVRLNSSSRHMLRENGILVIDQLQAPADGGEYICTVEGPSGKITSKTILEFKFHRRSTRTFSRAKSRSKRAPGRGCSAPCRKATPPSGSAGCVTARSSTRCRRVACNTLTTQP
ncbi:Down syndrome cell adhesion molecule protein Dscam2-like [Tropilaelaps mercedesae]|uniref:Down syndrome cell adhesion molecule protein Dscam2-like n=1 Tax=Tropilaelaps mercedesae TaxID=418985 RepID=A0A1V9X1B3_9ACAR|nr:Down syndrome cell adhesion molecule protein Dscam2-like [Tropilaelaps mercedesae]